MPELRGVRLSPDAVVSPTDAKERGKQAAKIVTCLTPIASADPAMVLPSQLLAEAQLVLEDRAGAIQTLLRCVNAEPNAPAAYPRLIELLQKDGRADEAERRLASFRAMKNLPIAIQRDRARPLGKPGHARRVHRGT
jgi:hypothetical protein